MGSNGGERPSSRPQLVLALLSADWAARRAVAGLGAPAWGIPEFGSVTSTEGKQQVGISQGLRGPTIGPTL